jgi:hypothetical protein
MIYFDDLLKSDNLDTAVSQIAKDFRAKYQFPDVNQFGVVVPDVETAASELEKQGIGPFFIASDTLEFWKEHGNDKTFSGKVGMAIHKGYNIELLEPGTGSTFYKSCVDKDGRMVLQHLGFMVKDVDAHTRGLEKSGCATWVRGRINALGFVTDFAYMDTVAQAGIILEFINMKMMGISVNVSAGIYHGLGRLEKMIGIRSISF